MEITNEEGMQPLHAACQNGNIEFVKLLLEHKCNVDVIDNSRRPPLHYACSNGHIEIVKLLLEHKFNVDVIDILGMSPLLHACIYGHIEIVKLLLEHKCDIGLLYDVIDYKSVKIANKTISSEILNLLKAAKKNPTMCSIALAMSLECGSGCSHRSCFISLSFKELKEKCHSIGSGAFGTVYKCSEYRQPFAIKVITVKSNSDVKKEAKKIEKNINKYRHVLKHDNIVKYFGSNSESDEMLIFMEYVDGKSLDKYMNKTPLPHDMIARFSKQILEGVGFLHQKKIIHRDIKPANIMLDCCGELIKLCDFGISRSLMTMSTLMTQEANTFCGTMSYMAPEIFMSNTYDFQVDIWSIGATVIEMLTGHPPFHETEPARIIYKLTQSKTIEYTPVQSMSTDLKSFVDHMIQFEPKDRATVDQLLQCRLFTPMSTYNDW